MDIKVAFHILEINQTKDEAPIREAYRRLIQVTNPEDDQEGFKRLRELMIQRWSTQELQKRKRKKQSRLLM